MAQSGDTQPDWESSDTEQFLRAQLAITPDAESNCAVVEEGTDSKDVTQHIKTDLSQLAGGTNGEDPESVICNECHTELAPDDPDGNRTYLTAEVHSKCVCPIFENHNCIPRIKSVQNGSIITVITVPTREELRAIIADLHAIDATISVDWLVKGSERDATTEIDVGSITEKQREALELAKESGYYETPRETSLGELANELGISESAASQRLNGAETKLVKSFLEE